ncbi:aminoglycoside adenylyltransferase family protein [Pedobacter sp. KBW06]|uniref:aminoglycoside adenylyltransferase family protein n=1 Tax=Pedobacter sp. KBW06 TaxID=2153359 RepID=UPI00131528A1|nr:aminoglycoside adenylyltransferase family protein [Pedobacter sp. KBW06]
MENRLVRKEIEKVVRVIKEEAGRSIAGIYLYGSAVDGGLQKESDIDILAIIDGSLSQKSKCQLVKKFMQVSGEIGNKQLIRPFEVTILNRDEISPWRHPVRNELQYGEWLRDEFLKGEIAGCNVNPDLTILLRQVHQSSITLTGSAAQEIIPEIPDEDIKQAIFDTLPILLQCVKGDERNTVLTLARMYYTLVVGGVTTKDRAADWLLSEIPVEFRDLLEMAKCGYLGICKDNWQGKGEALKKITLYLVQLIKQTVPTGKKT